MKKVLIVMGMALISGILLTSCDKLDPNSPEACFNVPAEIVAGIPAAFNSSCSANSNTYSWSFGDGGTSTDPNPHYTYSEGGSFTVTLMVTNEAGKSVEESRNIVVEMPSVIEHSGTIDSDETWIEGTHLVTSNIYVDGAQLTIEPGAVVMITANSGIYLGYHGEFSGATLVADGTAEKPIIFTSATSIKSAGDWDLIGFYDGASSASSMQYCEIEYGGGAGDSNGSVYIDGSSVSINNSTVRFSRSFGISLGDDGFFKSFTGNLLMVNSSNPISIYGNNAHTIGTGNTITTDKGIFVKADYIEREDVTWLRQTCAYIIYGNLYVESVTGAKLTLNPGVEVQLGGNAAIYVGYHNDKFGTLVAEGTESEHIRFTSSASEMSRSPGDWDMIAFYGGAGSRSSLAYCDFEYGGGDSDSYGMIYVDGSSISMTNSTVKYAKYTGITLMDDGSFETFSENTFEGNGNFPIEMYSNYVHTLGTGNSFNTGPGIFVKTDYIEQTEATWLKQNVPYILAGSHYIESPTGANLTIEPGTMVKFSAGAGLYVGYHSDKFGNLIAVGDPVNMITFTTGVAAGFENPGDWDGISFLKGTGPLTILDHCVISYGGGSGNNSGNLNINNDSDGVPEISNCIIENSAAYGIYQGNNAKPTLTTNIYENNASGDTNK